jgi:hypothetical protein
MTGLHLRPPISSAVQFKHLQDMGDGLAAACADLCRDPSPERADALLMKLGGAQEGVRQFRRQLVADQDSRRDRD